MIFECIKMEETAVGRAGKRHSGQRKPERKALEAEGRASLGIGRCAGKKGGALKGEPGVYTDHMAACRLWRELRDH